MSLLNDVLRDLQSRGAPEPRPLDGLAPVASVKSGSAVPLWPVAVVVLAAAIFAWRPITVALAHDRPEAPAETVATELPGPVAPAPAAPVVDAPEPAPAAPVADAAAAVAAAPVPETTVPVPAAPVADTRPEDVTAPAAPPVAEEPQPAPEPDADVPAAAAETLIVRRQPAEAEDGNSAPLGSGLQALQSGNLAAAEKFFGNALAIDASDARAWSYLYETQARAGKVAAAEQTLQRALGAASETAALANLYARLLIKRGETARAIAVLHDHRPAQTPDSDYDAFLAALLQQQGRYAEAGSLYQELLDRDPEPGAWWIGLAMSSDSLGDRAAALAAFERALRADRLKQPLANYARRRIAELENNG